MGIFKSSKTKTGPSFCIIETSIPASEENTLLGKIVADIQNPTYEYANYTPASYTEVLGNRTLEIKDMDVKYVYEQNKSSEVQAKLGSLLSGTSTASANNANNLTTCFVRTRTLQQQREVFQCLLDKNRDSIMKLLQDNGNTAYMIVGFKTAVDGAKSRLHTTQSHAAFHVQLPATEVAQAVTGAPPFLPGEFLNPQAGFSRQVGERIESSNTMQGEQIFAVQYRRLRARKPSADDHVTFGELERYKKEAAVFHDENDGPILLEEDDEDVDEENEIHADTEGDASNSDPDDASREVDDDEVDFGDHVESVGRTNGKQLIFIR
ncbi:hypothetical protein Q7P35_000005 [Cladosporium inversicolor]